MGCQGDGHAAAVDMGSELIVPDRRLVIVANGLPVTSNLTADQGVGGGPVQSN